MSTSGGVKVDETQSAATVKPSPSSTAGASEETKNEDVNEDSCDQGTEGESYGSESEGESDCSEASEGGNSDYCTEEDSEPKEVSMKLTNGLTVVGPSEAVIRMSFAMEFNTERGDTDIGEFRTGPVYRVTYDNKSVVVKIGYVKKDEILQAEMLNEERVYSKLKQYNLQGDIVPELVYAGPMLGCRHAIATSDCGQTLDAWAKTATPAQIYDASVEARMKLRKLHEVGGVLHGDVTAQNITVDSDGKVFLIDLAFATHLDDPESSEAMKEREELEVELGWLNK
jgi:tRNA A-37 threonylcarbamoyl transferase component Bud32